MVKLAASIFRDFVTDGVPSSGAYPPKKAEIREWGAYLEALYAAAQAGGGVVFQTKGSMTLGYAANQIAWVVADATVANNGIYQKQGSSGSGSWTKVAELPYSVIYAQNDNSGTANAVKATANIPVSSAPYSQLISVPFTQANTGAMTLSINNETPRSLVTNTGQAIPTGYMQPGMAALLQIDSAGKYRLFSYGDAVAIQAAAEAALAEFKKWYLGAFANDAAATAAAGGAPTTGAEYWNTSLNKRRTYTGTLWQDASVVLNDGDVTTPKLADGAVTEQKLSSSFTLQLAGVVPDIAALRMVSTIRYTTAFVRQDPVGGLFAWINQDLSGGPVSRPLGTTTSISGNTITLAAHKLLTRQAVCVLSSVNGLLSETVYYVIKLTADTFRLASSFQNAAAGTAVTLTGSTNFTLRRLMDPLQAIFVIPAGKSITGSNGAWKRSEYADGGDIYTKWFGATGDYATDATPAFFFALDFCEKRPAIGGVVRAQAGAHRITSMLRVGSYSSLIGAGMYSSVMYFDAAISSGNLIEYGPDNCIDGTGNTIFGYFGDYVFGARIENFDIKGGEFYRGTNAALIYTRGAHQPSGIFNCFVRDVVARGIYLDVGAGGPANFKIQGCDIQGAQQANTGGAGKYGILLDGAGAIVDIDTVNIQGHSADRFLEGISASKDHLTAKSVHFEQCLTGINCRQNEPLKRSNALINITGHSSVPVLINRSTSNNNTLVVLGAFNQSSGTTGLVVVRDNGAAVASDTSVSFLKLP